MLFIIFGSRVRWEKLDEGDFYCPYCRQPRHYELKRARRYFSLYFIPLIPMGTVGEFVECQTCQKAFDPEVLTVRPAPMPAQKPDLARMLNNVDTILQKGVPVEYLVRDLTAAGLDRDVALNMVRDQLTDGEKSCDTCGLTYHVRAKRCASCEGVV